MTNISIQEIESLQVKLTNVSKPSYAKTTYFNHYEALYRKKYFGAWYYVDITVELDNDEQIQSILRLDDLIKQKNIRIDIVRTGWLPSSFYDYAPITILAKGTLANSNNAVKECPDELYEKPRYNVAGYGWGCSNKQCTTSSYCQDCLDLGAK